VPGYEELRAAALELFGQAVTSARRAGADVSVQRLQAGRDRLISSQLTVVVCGEFSRGKSTLINAFLGQQEDEELLPTGISYTTSLITTIRHGERERITVTLADGDTLEITRATLQQYVTQDGNPGNGKRVVSAAIEWPSDQLTSGLALVDTPGIGGLYTEHTAVTSDALALADAIVFVADAVQPITASEVRFLSRAIEAAQVSGDREALICVLTKIDQADDPSELVDSTRAKLAQATGWPQVRVVAVSSQAKLDYLRSHDEDDLADSNFPELERVLWDALTRRRAKAVLASAVQDIDAAARALLEPVEAELAMLRAAGPEAAAELRRTFEEQRRKLDGFGVAAATWRGDLIREVSVMAADVVKGALDNADRAWRNVPGYLHDDTLLADLDRLFQAIDEDLAGITGIADRMLYDRAARVQRDLAAHLELDLGPVEIGRLPLPPVPALRESLASAQPPGRGDPASRGASRALSAAASVGTTVELMVRRLAEMLGTGTLGGRLGATAGLLVSRAERLARWRNPDDAVRKLSPREVRRQLQADLDEYYKQVLCPYLRSHVTQAADEWRVAITAETESRIRQKAASVADSESRLRAPAPADTGRMAERDAALSAERESLLAMRRGAARLAADAAEFATREGPGPGQEATGLEATGPNG
jgi:GTPase Era involved in 16S rRNA processing